MTELYIPAEKIVKENNFWAITDDNQVIFPRFDKQLWTSFWWAYFNDRSRFKLVSVGRGGGKTHNIAFEQVDLAVTNYQKIKASGTRYTGIQWHAAFIFPSEENATECIAMLKEIIPEIPGYAPDGNLNYRVRDSDTTDFRLFGDNELVISVYSSFSADTLRGKNFDQVWLDECLKVRRNDVIDVIIPASDRPGRDDLSGWFLGSSTPDNDDGDPLQKWWDDACDEADPEKPHISGYFSDFSLHSGPFTVNPKIPEDRFQRILKQSLLDLVKWQRERLALRGLVAQVGRNADGSVGNVWSYDQLRPCFYQDQITPKSVLCAVDLAFGHTDSLVRMWYCQVARKVFDIEILRPEEQNKIGIQPKAYEKGIVAFFTETASKFPGAPIVYDANSEHNMPVEHLIPRYLRTTPVKKNNAVKVGLVTTLIERLAEINQDGICTSIQLPDPDALWLTTRQRNDFKWLYKEMINYQRTIKENDEGKRKIIYNKPSTGTDDALDALLLLMTQSKPTGTNRISATQARKRRYR